MFKQLFHHPRVISRHANAPLADERITFLSHLASRGTPSSTLFHQHDSNLARTCLTENDQPLCGMRPENESPRPSSLRSYVAQARQTKNYAERRDGFSCIGLMREYYVASEVSKPQ